MAVLEVILEAQIQGTALQDGTADSDSSTITITGVLRGQETLNFEDNGHVVVITEHDPNLTPYANYMVSIGMRAMFHCSMWP